MGGEQALAAMGADRRIRAVVAEGATGMQLADHSWLPQDINGTLQRGMEWVQYTAAGLLSGAPRPMSIPDSIRAASGRPMLIIAGGSVADEPVAATNLGVIFAERGSMRQALSVWRPAFERHPDASELGVDVALAMCRSGDWKDAEEAVRTVLEHNPDFLPARQVGAALARGPDACHAE